jgi:hypothetical protein
LCLLLGISEAEAAVTATPVFPQTPKGPLAQILNGTGTAQVTLVTAGANGSKVISIVCSSTDTVDRSLNLTRVRSATSYLLTQVDMPALSGDAGSSSGFTPPVGVIAQGNIPGLPMDSDGNAFIYLESGDTLVINTTVTLTSAKIIACSAVSADF